MARNDMGSIVQKGIDDLASAYRSMKKQRHIYPSSCHVISISSKEPLLRYLNHSETRENRPCRRIVYQPKSKG